MTNEQKREQVKIALQSGFTVAIKGPFGDFTLTKYNEVPGRYCEFLESGDKHHDLDFGYYNFDFEILPRTLPELKVGQKVKIITNRSDDFYPNQVYIVQDVYDNGDGYGNNIGLDNGNDVPSEWLCPVIEEEERETITIGENTYDKVEFEEAVKNLKTVNK